MFICLVCGAHSHNTTARKETRLRLLSRAPILWRLDINESAAYMFWGNHWSHVGGFFYWDVDGMTWVRSPLCGIFNVNGFFSLITVATIVLLNATQLLHPAYPYVSTLYVLIVFLLFQCLAQNWVRHYWCGCRRDNVLVSWLWILDIGSREAPNSTLAKLRFFWQ